MLPTTQPNLHPSPPPTAAQAGLLSAQVGFNALFFGRADYQVGAAPVDRPPAQLIVRIVGVVGTGLAPCTPACTPMAGPQMPSCRSCLPLTPFKDMEHRRGHDVKAMEVVWRGSASLQDATVFAGNLPSGRWAGSGERHARGARVRFLPSCSPLCSGLGCRSRPWSIYTCDPLCAGRARLVHPPCRQLRPSPRLCLRVGRPAHHGRPTTGRVQRAGAVRPGRRPG